MGKLVPYDLLKNANWDIWEDDSNKYTNEQIGLAVLMDIRSELQTLNRIMQCRTVAVGFAALAKIAMRDEKAFKRRVEAAARKRVARKVKR